MYCFHNLLGNEVHWLPSRYLQRWWNASVWAKEGPEYTAALRTIERGNTEWCPELGVPRPEDPKKLTKTFDTCNVKLAERWDDWSDKFWKKWQGDDKIVNYGPLYATIPLQRTTVLREPFSWMVSKFFWHGITSKKRIQPGVNCTNTKDASRREYPHNLGWATKFALDYLFYLCGDDCINRYEKGRMTIKEIEAQAEYNLRYSFSVVGLLEESQTFYNMVTTRVSYIDMGMNPEVMGKSHSTGKKADLLWCKEQYKDKDFQAQFLRDSPEMAALVRLYKVAQEVNAAQIAELKQCPGSPLNEMESK